MLPNLFNILNRCGDAAILKFKQLNKPRTPSWIWRVQIFNSCWSLKLVWVSPSTKFLFDSLSSYRDKALFKFKKLSNGRPPS